MSRLPKLAVIFYLITLTLSANAARILRHGDRDDEVVISQNARTPFGELDRVCFYQGKTEIACGNIVKSNRKSAVVRVDSRKDIIRQTHRDSKKESYVELKFGKARLQGNERIALVTPEDLPVNEEKAQLLLEGVGNATADRNMASESEDVLSIRAPTSLTGREDLLTELDPLTSSGGRISNVSGGLLNFFPEIQYQRMVKPHWAAGGMALLMNSSISDGTIKGFGAYATVNYYRTEPFRGVWAQGGLGLVSLTAASPTSSVKFVTPALLLNCGYRWRWPSGWNFGFGLGAQALFKSKPADSNLVFSGILPSMALDVGFNF